MSPRLLRILLSCGLALCATASAAEQVLFAPDDFLAGAFGGEPPPAQVIWLAGDLGAQAARILEHRPSALRVRYWRIGRRSAWILEEIGKELPITAGFVVDDGAIAQAQVLIYRESRGGEIQLPSFLQQFRQARLRGHELDRRVDNITGATLSVRAMQRMAQLALLLDHAADSS